MVKMTFTLDDETVAVLRKTTARLAKPQSAVVREAIRDAVAAFGDARVVELAAPSTPEAIYNAISKVRGNLA